MNQKNFLPLNDSDLRILNDTVANAKILEVATDKNNLPCVMIEISSGDVFALHGNEALFKILRETKQRRQLLKAADTILSITAEFYGKDVASYDEYSDLTEDVIKLLVEADSETFLNDQIKTAV